MKQTKTKEQKLKEDISEIKKMGIGTCPKCHTLIDNSKLQIEAILESRKQGKAEAQKEFEKMIDECNTYIPLVKSEFSGEGMDGAEAIMEEDRDGEWIRAKELKLKLHSQQETSAKSETQSSYGELVEASMQRKPKQQHNPAGTNSQNEKLVKCIACGKPIHIDELAGITNEGMYHNNLVCFMKISEWKKYKEWAKKKLKEKRKC